MKGEVFKKRFSVITDPAAEAPTIDYTDNYVERCSVKLPVLATPLNADPLQNDFTGFYFGYSSIVSSCVLKLYKCDELKATLNSTTYGTFFAFGFHDDGKKKYIGYKLNWKLVLAAFGEGEYFVKCEATLITSQVIEENSFVYCLNTYYPSTADGTVRLEFIHNGIIGDWKRDADVKSFKDLNWYSSIRIPDAMIYGERAEFESEEIQYTNGEKQDVKLEQEPLYDLIIAKLPVDLHRYMRVEVLTSSDITVSDYNAINPLRPFLNKELKYRGNYEPQWKGLSNTSSVLIGFKQKINNLRKRFC